MSAYAYYEARRLRRMRSPRAQRYITLHPGSPDAAYAQYLIGSSYFDQIPDVTRDQGRTEKAIAALDEVVRKYPDHRIRRQRQAEDRGRARPARRQGDGDRPLLPGASKDYTGAINRFKIVVTQYQTTRHVEEALMRLTEAYMALGIVEEAQTAAAVLGHNFPDSPWYKDAYGLVKTGGFEPAENKGSWISRAFKKIGSRLRAGERPGRSRPMHCPQAVAGPTPCAGASTVLNDGDSGTLLDRPACPGMTAHTGLRHPCWPGSRSATSS